VLLVSEKGLMQVIANVAQRYAQTDETVGDMVETRDTLLWLATRGEQGRDWGGAGVAAKELGIWPFEHMAVVMADKWICSYAKDFKPCYEPAVWIIEVGQLQMGACGVTVIWWRRALPSSLAS